MKKASRWIQHFKDVLNRPEFNEIADPDPSDYLNINAHQPSQVEDETAAKAMKNGKTPGINSLQAEEAICTKRSCDIIFMKKKVIWFCLQKTISGSYLKQNNSDLVFQTWTIFWKWVSSQLVMWPNCDF